MDCLIFGSAPIENYDYIKEYIKKDSFVICADGGIRHAEALGIFPGAVIGDFDSGTFPEKYKNVIKYPAEKDFTDMSLCLSYALEKNFEHIYIFGGLGGRIDHSLANISLLVSSIPSDVRLIDRNTEIFVTDSKRIIKKGGKKYASFISFTEYCRVSYKGMKYPLCDYLLSSKNAQLGISNEITDSEAEITVQDGILICILSND